MKISPGMVEAGATRWAAVKHLSPESIVAAVYEAMDKLRDENQSLRWMVEHLIDMVPDDPDCDECQEIRKFLKGKRK